jgi:hypothetical protein
VSCTRTTTRSSSRTRALLTSSSEGRTGYIHADLRDPAAILTDAVTKEILDFSKPIALTLVAILHFIMDEDEPERILRSFLDILPPGSYLVASHLSGEHDEASMSGAEQAYKSAGIRGQARDSDEFARLAFSGLELIPPGVVLVSEWRPGGTGPRPIPSEVNCYGGVARKN